MLRCQSLRLPVQLVASTALLAAAGFLSGQDRPKASIEGPVKKTVAQSSAPVTDNPRVAPGLVHWHKDFDAACAAAQKSGKPVLLFQMLGKLDEQFC